MGAIGNGVRPHSASVASPLSLGGRSGGMARLTTGESIGARAAQMRYCEPGPADQTTRRSRQTYARPQPCLAPWQVNLAKKMMAARVGETMQVSELSCACGLSMSHFVRAFSNTVGISPYSWFIGQRILRAMTLLAQSRSPIAEIALECGFADQSHLTNTFVRRTGITPRQWREEARGAQSSGPLSAEDGISAAALLADVATANAVRALRAALRSVPCNLRAQGDRARRRVRPASSALLP